MNTTTDVKKGYLSGLLTTKQKGRLAITSKTQAQWLLPILKFVKLPLNQKIIVIKSKDHPLRGVITDDLIIETLKKSNNHVILISLLKELPDHNRKLKKEIRRLIETSFITKKQQLIKQTIIKHYLKYLIEANKQRRINELIDELKAGTRSLFIEQYILLEKKNLSQNKLTTLLEKITDPIIKRRITPKISR